MFGEARRTPLQEAHVKPEHANSPHSRRRCLRSLKIQACTLQEGAGPFAPLQEALPGQSEIPSSQHPKEGSMCSWARQQRRQGTRCLKQNANAFSVSLRLTMMETLGIVYQRKLRQQGTRFFKENTDTYSLSFRHATLERIGVARLRKR